jgi:hypothetical protein
MIPLNIHSYSHVVCGRNKAQFYLLTRDGPCTQTRSTDINTQHDRTNKYGRKVQLQIIKPQLRTLLCLSLFHCQHQGVIPNMAKTFFTSLQHPDHLWVPPSFLSNGYQWLLPRG